MFYFSPISLWSWTEGDAPAAGAAAARKSSMLAAQHNRRRMNRRGHRFVITLLGLGMTHNVA